MIRCKAQSGDAQTFFSYLAGHDNGILVLFHESALDLTTDYGSEILSGENGLCKEDILFRIILYLHTLYFSMIGITSGSLIFLSSIGISSKNSKSAGPLIARRNVQSS